jgi:hypothetical protein
MTGNVTERTFSLEHQAGLVSTAGAVDVFWGELVKVCNKVVTLKQRKRSGEQGWVGGADGTEDPSLGVKER